MPPNNETTKKPQYSFVQCGAVAVGAFNTHIIHPGWLNEHEIIDVPDIHPVEIDLQQPGFRLKLETSTWVIRPDRLVVECDNPTLDPGRLIGRILTLLPFTPVQAVGLNYKYEGKSRPSRLVVWDSFADSTEYSVKQRSWHIALQGADGDPVVKNFQTSEHGDKVVIAANFHTEAKGMTSDDVIRSLNSHSKNMLEMDAILREVFGVNVA